MKILIDIGHPAHVHMFKNFARQMIETDNVVLLTCRDRDNVIHLIKHYQFDYVNFGRHFHNPLLKIIGLFYYSLKEILVSLKFRPDFFFSHGSPYAALASCVVRKPHISFEDTFNMEQVRLYLPFTDVVLTGDHPHPSLGKKEITYPAYKELAYLHPNVYEPDIRVLDTLGVARDENYAIIRFVAWNASHDIGLKGISIADKVKLVRLISNHMRVFITSEEALPPELSAFKINIRPEQMHDALFYAQLFVGEGATMASESALLGTPAVFIHDTSFGSISDQAAHGLLFQYPITKSGIESAVKKIQELIGESDIKARFAQLRYEMLDKKIDVTAFLIWFVTNYPQSKSIMTNNPEYTSRFL